MRQNDSAGRLRAAREALGLSQDKFANKCGIDRVRITNFESGRNKLTGIGALGALARGFAVSLDQLRAYLDGNTAIDVFVQQMRDEKGTPIEPVSEPPRRSGASDKGQAGQNEPRAEPVTEPPQRHVMSSRLDEDDDPYPERTTAIELMRGVVDDETLRSVRSLRLKTSERLTVDDWVRKTEDMQVRRNEVRKRILLSATPPPHDDDDAPDVSPESLARAAAGRGKKRIR